jgi:histidinol dehydrogenase
MWKAVTVEEWSGQRKAGLSSVKGAVEQIIERVREGGDDALIELTEQFDHVRLEQLAVSDEERDAAYNQVDTLLVEALIEAEARIEQFHEMQRPRGLWLEETDPGIILGVKTTPLARIGAYVPGGRAAYPSTALMCTVPAVVAGVPSICCCSPPPVHPLTLVALDIAGVEEIYQVGGAQAIAAMAIGTRTIAPVQKIVGPGNLYVTAAKMQLREYAEIDFPAGPSEIAIIADETADPEFIAADIIAQAEHDPHAAGLLVTTDDALAIKVGRRVDMMARGSFRREIVMKALSNCGYLVVGDIGEAIQVIDRIAPEHLSLQVADPMPVLSRVRNAGSIFIGPYSPVACGDYSAGTNHVLPTAGYSNVYSGLDVHHFCKRSSVQMIDREGLESIGDITELIAGAEGQHAHAKSVHIRRKRK